jgi:hypothetical protein
MPLEGVHHLDARSIGFASSSLLAGRRRLRRSLPVSAAELPNDAVIDHAARLLQWSIRLRGGEQRADSRSAGPPASAWGAEVEIATDRMLWALVAVEPAGSIDAIGAVPGLRLDSSGPLLDRGPTDAVEVWVDRELAAMHALHRAARIHQRSEWNARLHDAVDWHVEHTGTENATHRPWAAHVFLMRGTPEAEFFASGQVHAVLVEHGDAAPDPCTRWILGDAAAELALAVGADPSRLP